MAMKPIETRYKNYLFRSRLEARWAKFFDVLGIKYQYEPEGFEFQNGTKYLPDFYLSDWDAYIEVKPSNFKLERDRTPYVYLAGKMGEWQDNKTPGVCWRPFDAMPSDCTNSFGYPSEEFGDIDIGHIEDRDFLGRPIKYVGPWKGRADNHCYMHGVTTCGEVAENEILARALAGIDNSDIVFALLDDESAIGTFSEIGYALAKNKTIIVGSIQKEEGWYVDSYFSSQMWFPASMATKVVHGQTLDEVLEKFKLELDVMFPLVTQKEAVALNEFNKANRSYVIVMGDPIEVFDSSVVGNLIKTRAGSELISHIKKHSLLRKASIDAREARFEFRDAA